MVQHVRLPLGIPASCSSVRWSSATQLLIQLPTKAPGGQQLMAKVLEFLEPKMEAWMEFGPSGLKSPSTAVICRVNQQMKTSPCV